MTANFPLNKLTSLQPDNNELHNFEWATTRGQNPLNMTNQQCVDVISFEPTTSGGQ